MPPDTPRSEENTDFILDMAETKETEIFYNIMEEAR